MKTKQKEWMKRGQMIFGIVCLSFILGAAGGAAAANLIGQSGREELAAVFQGVLDTSTPAGFGYVFWKYFKYDLLIWAGGWLSMGVFLSGCVFLFRSISLGFTSAMLMSAYGKEGVLLAASALLPQNLILIPVYVLMMTAAMYYMGTWEENGGRKRAGKREKRRRQTEYCILLAGSVVLMVAAGVIEVGLIPLFMEGVQLFS